MKVKSESEIAQSCPTLSDPMDCSPPDFSINGIFQARVLEWGAIALSGGLETVVQSLSGKDPREKEMATHSMFLPGESQGRGSLVGCRLWGRTDSDTTEVT